MKESLNRLKEIVYEVADLTAAAALLSWDLETYMPPGGAESRGEQLATLGRLAHERVTSAELGRLLDGLMAQVDELDPDSDDACLIRRAHDEYTRQTRVPTSFVTEMAIATTAAHEAWVQARKGSDFSAFRPFLERNVELQRQYAGFFAPYDHVYDTLLHNYERGMKTADVQAIFNALRPQQVELIRAIGERPQVDDSFLHLDYPEQDQWDFGVEVITRFGFDWQRGRQDRSPHPFTSSFTHNDVRITTRFDPERAASALFSTMHEAGHAMYEQGMDPALTRTPLEDAASLGVHESQSRMWENLVGRSLPFWKFFYPQLKARFPQQLADVDLMTLYRGINRVEPSLIRVEADEATYNLHIMMRMELEIALMEGSLEVKDLPEAWNARMQEYLGLTPPDDAQGVLQDVHWAAGLFGYFPTYALGNLISVQLWEAIHRAVPDLEAQMERGVFSDLLAWLRENIHRHGAKYEPQALVQRATGSKIDPQPYIRYLREKYRQIYNF